VRLAGFADQVFAFFSMALGSHMRRNVGVRAVERIEYSFTGTCLVK